MRLTEDDRLAEILSMDTTAHKPTAKPRRIKPPGSSSVSASSEMLSGSSESSLRTSSDDTTDVVQTSDRPVPKPRPRPRPVSHQAETEPLPACMTEDRNTSRLDPEDRKRMTINIFGKVADPFDVEFEESLKDASLTTINIALEDGKSTEDSGDDSSEDEGSENYSVPSRGLSVVQQVQLCPGEPQLGDKHLCSDRVEAERESVYETISNYSSSESGLSEAGRGRPLSRVSNFGGSRNSLRSEGDRPPPVPPFKTQNGAITKQAVAIILPRHTAIGDTFADPGEQPSQPPPRSTRKSIHDIKPIHPYDDVAIEDGCMTIDGHIVSHLDVPTGRSTDRRNQSRKSLLQEFDPLLCQVNSTYEDIDDGEFDSIVYANPADSSDVGNSKADVELGEDIVAQNPQYSPVTNDTAEDNIPAFADFEHADGTVLQQDEVYEPVNVRSPSIHVSAEDDVVDKRSSSGSSALTDGTSPPSSPLNVAENASQLPKNIFSRFTSSIRRIPTIMEETREPRAAAIDQPQCPRCCQTHADSRTSKCKFVPTPRENIVYSSILHKASGLGKRDFSSRWAYLSKGSIYFASRSSPNKPTDTVKLERVVMVAKKEDQRVGEVLYKCFQLYLGNGRHSTMVLAGTSDTGADRSNWMQKYVEAFTSNFPSHVISSYDRAGWCFIKENATGKWTPCWLVLSDRNLYYSFVNGEDYFELDLRKVREINLGPKDAEYQCTFVENKDVLTMHMITKILYVQTESSKLTANWEKALRAAALCNGNTFEEMQLTTDDVPVIVHNCIDFLYAHGLLSVGIYRQSGANSRIAGLLEEFKKDAWAVQMSPKDFSAHDVAGALKRFFRTLPEPLVTDKLYAEWISVYGIKSRSVKMEQYLKLLNELPRINYNILKKLIQHLHAVHEMQESNLMPLDNLAPIWGPTLMSVDEGAENTSKLVQSYEIVCAQCGVVRDLIENYYTLFQVDSQEIDRARRIQEGLKKFYLGADKRKTSGDMRIYVYLHERDENSAISITLNPSMTAASIVEHICKTKFQHRKYENLALHEVIFNKSLERPVYPTEKVVDIISTWSKWDMEERKSNYLILKTNTLYPVLIPYARDPAAVFGDFKYVDSKSGKFRKYSFEFSGAKLKYFKDSKEVESWNIEDITWYIGYEPKRIPPCKYNLTFTPKSYDFRRSKEEPYFGNVLSMNEEDERHKFIAAMIIGEATRSLWGQLKPNQKCLWMILDEVYNAVRSHRDEEIDDDSSVTLEE